MTKDVFIREVRDAEAMLYHITKSILNNDSDCGDAVQETMQESTYIQNIDQSVTQNGVTVTLTDSVQDQGFLYAFF